MALITEMHYGKDNAKFPDNGTRFRKEQIRLSEGGITVFVSMLLLVMIILIGTAVTSLQTAVGRCMILSGTQQGLFSVFAQYDRDLYRKYGLLFVDGGYGTSEFQPGALLEEVCTEAGYSLHPESSGGRSPVTIREAEGGRQLKGMVLATDLNGEAVARQVCEIMEAETGSGAGIGEALQLAASYSLEQLLERKREEITVDTICALFQDSGIETLDEEALNDIVPIESNPADYVQAYKKNGILWTVLGNEGKLSQASLNGIVPVSDRTCSYGIGMEPEGWQKGNERLYLQKYLMEHYPCYTGGPGESGLQYQLEYAICGKYSDMENLRLVLHRLLAIREASNLMYLLSDSEKQAEVEELAVGISVFLLSPELVPEISAAVLLAWAWGESILDLQTLLLDNGEIPLLKNADDWQLPLYALIDLNGIGRSCRHSADTGMNYRSYLGMLLIEKGTRQLTEAVMDLTEINMRTTEGRTEFRLDACVDALAMAWTLDAGKKRFTVEQSYGYSFRNR
ncbi:MAG: DUF5702 domain-containing protein [Eubacteriales bacterium]|nr:DUF5702 domain-containing protein [Eubacteriales bacterium]